MVITLREEGRLGQAQRMQAATRSWKINSGACGRMLTGSLLASRAGKGIYHVKKAIASSTLQIAPSAYICTHIHTHTSVPAQGLAPSTWPLSVAERVYSLWQWHSVVLLEMELSPSNLRHCRELAHIEPRVLWPSCPTSRGEKLSAPGTTPSIQPHARWCFLYLLVLNELETILYSSVSQTVSLCRARLICFARSCLKMTDRVLIKPEQIQSSGHWFIRRCQEIVPPGWHFSVCHPLKTLPNIFSTLFITFYLFKPIPDIFTTDMLFIFRMSYSPHVE